MLKSYHKILVSSFVLAFLSGCGGVNPLASKPQLDVDENLPKVALTKRGIVTQMNEVAFEWKSLAKTPVEGVKIYRFFKDANQTKLIHSVENKYATHYVDLDVKPQQTYHYILRTFKEEKVSQPLEVDVATKPILSSIAWIYAVNGLPRMAKIIWRPHKNEKVCCYIVERRTIDDEDWEKIATLEGRLQAEYIDTDLKDKYTYRYRIRAKTFDGIISVPSETVKVITKPLPPVVEGLQATTDLPKQIDLTWSKSTYKDFERYYLYRSKSKDGSYTLIAKLYNNHFSDPVEEDGAKYFYKVTQKDIDGLESPVHTIVMGSTLAKPFAPTIQEVKKEDNKIVVKWFKIDPRSVSYIVHRKAKTGFFDTEEKDFKTTKKEFIDTQIQPDTTYTYSVYAIDKYGIVSSASNEVSIDVKSLTLAIPQAEESVTQPRESKQTKKPATTASASEDDVVEIISVDNTNVEEE